MSNQKIIQPGDNLAEMPLWLRALGNWLGLLGSKWDGRNFDSSMRYRTILTQKEVLDLQGHIVRREVPYQSPTQGLQPGNRLVGKRNRTRFSKFLFGLQPMLLLLVF